MEKQETFVVHIIDQKNSTWQGKVTWLGEKETRTFRSLLELIKLIDTVIHVDGLDQSVPVRNVMSR